MVVNETVADRISDKIVDLLDEERKLPDFTPVSALCGQALALLGFLVTAPQPLPPEMQILAEALQLVLNQAE